eukprot:TRINITY_DN65635_c0_g1_i1.p1 TRINITY_DN65635_c0_g1~~TRINITY_DN65635_c0_g1_i1.p1  ORF type:complete len:229 (-),score=37.17 TRINITY_DN65635_c0_g1_i1:49-735(-)
MVRVCARPGWRQLQCFRRRTVRSFCSDGLRSRSCVKVQVASAGCHEKLIAAADLVDAERAVVQPVQRHQPPCRMEGKQLIEAIAAVYISVVSVANQAKYCSWFHGIRKPTIGILDYLLRLHQYFFCSEACFLSAMVYIQRIMKCRPDVVVNSLSIHRLLATSLVVSAKFNDDTIYSNVYYAKVTGMDVKELNKSEIAFLKLLDWKLDVSPEEYHDCYDQVVAQSTLSA